MVRLLNQFETSTELLLSPAMLLHRIDSDVEDNEDNGRREPQPEERPREPDDDEPLEAQRPSPANRRPSVSDAI
jgi:hypothetical protein